MKEIWKDIEGYENYYQVSNLGRVRSLDRAVTGPHSSKQVKVGKVLVEKPGNRGYILNTLCRNGECRTFQTHRIVALEFLENKSNLPQVNHKNGIKTDNNVKNLEWCSISYNITHAISTGLNPVKFGENTSQVKLSSEQVIEIKEILTNKRMKQKNIAKKFNVSAGNISRISRGETWKHIPWPKPEDSN